MIFARYVGPKLGSSFTNGKLYLGTPGFSGAGAVDLDQFYVVNDYEKRVLVKIKESPNLFEFPEEVYAVVLKEVGPFLKGEVVTVVDAEDDFLDIKGQGYYNSNGFELLDRTNVLPGIFVLDQATRRWEKVSVLDGDMNIGLEGEGLRPITDFRFAVGHEGIMSEPLLKCVNASGAEDSLTEGKVYRLESMATGEDLIFLTNDNGEIQSYMLSRFSSDL